MGRMNDGAHWFKTTFGDDIAAKVAGTPFTVDLLTAIAIQETYEIWGRTFDKLTPDAVLDACVGDVISEEGGRSAFPKSKAVLLAAPGGAAMFDVARQALIDMSVHAPEYKIYIKNPDRFCHAFGVFQYDIQFFKNDPSFFLERKWRDLDECLTRCVAELTRVTKATFGANKNALSDLEATFVAIGYNQGSVNVKKGLKQGHKDADGKYYGEYVAEYLALAKAA
jgi:hypothetical protein